MVLIDIISARQILNSLGEPTIEVSLSLTNGESVTSSCPAGKSTSSHAALMLLDKDFSNYFGKSVNHAVESINETIAPRLKKIDPAAQEKIDKILYELDGTPNLAHLGANTTLAVSMAVAKAGAISHELALYDHLNELFIKIDAKDHNGEHFDLTTEQIQKKLPIPAFNLIEGGAHADSPLAVQEYLVLPVGVEKMVNKVRAGAEIRHQLGMLLKKAGKPANIGDEGGYASTFKDPVEALDMVVEAVHKTNYHVKNKVLYGFDVAGAQVPDGFYEKVLKNYPVISVEDPYGEDATNGGSTIIIGGMRAQVDF